MTREQTRRIIEVEQAYVDGKEIEENWGAGWCLSNEPSWEWQRCNYRIKPTPIEGWMNVYPGSVFKTFEEARDRAPLSDEIKTIKVREVEE